MLEDMAAFGANNSFFACNDRGQCSSGACAGQSCEWNPAKPDSKSKRADDDDGDPMDVDSSQNCISAIPAMMYNCKYFPDMTLSGRSLPGVCQNIMKYFTQAGLGSGPFSATFSLEGQSENGTNRQAVCGRKSGHKYSITDESGKQVEYEGT
ncbi:chitinase A1 [Penicillium vulpinum]|uniref:chitinase A1 n=1 Tax=Penicillium vulpinum TaxID=29845 RepID=UPI00254873C6|nr:chitinase A1 [Penicillium vulpinum]KAJ5951951.1 chitinase A1 [Penicillium vulpinum]